MQALCPKCHQKKTASENKNMKNESYKQLNLFELPKEPIKLRRHQKEFMEICKLLKGGEQIGKIIMLVTPGGGKSLIPVIAAAQLIPNRASGGRFDYYCRCHMLGGSQTKFASSSGTQF